MSILLVPQPAAENWWMSDGAATIIAAVIAASALIASYFIQQRRTRRERRAQAYGEAIRAVEDYLEAPFLILRRDDTIATQHHITDHISSVQSRIAFHKAELAIHASQAIADAYANFVMVARADAGEAMTKAWRTKPIRRNGRQVPIEHRYTRVRSDAALAKVVKLMRADVRGDV